MPPPTLGGFLLGVLDFSLLLLDVGMSLLLLVPQIVAGYLASIKEFAIQLLYIALPSTLIDTLHPTWRRQPSIKYQRRSTSYRSLQCRRAFFYGSNGELFTTEQLASENSRRTSPSTSALSLLSQSAAIETPILTFPLPPLASIRNMPAMDEALHVIFFVVTGNPGSCHFYRAFINELAMLSSSYTVDIRCVSFAGHQSHRALKTSKQPRLFGLNDQIAMWRAVIREALEEKSQAKVAIAGHSIGAYIALQLLPVIPADRLMHAFLLFPTLMEMARTPAGQKLWPLFTVLARTPIALTGWLLAKLIPNTVIKLLIRFALGAVPNTLPSLQEREDIVDAVMSLLQCSVIQQILYLASTELATVRALPSALIAKYEQQLTFLLSPMDEWCPPSQQHQLKSQFPNARIRVMPIDVQHAFVVGASSIVAEQVWRDLKRDMQHAARSAANGHCDADDNETDSDGDELPLTQADFAMTTRSSLH